MPKKADIQLAEMIQTLRDELQRAQEQSAGSGILFTTEKVELELQVAVSRSAKGQGGVEFWVVNAGGELEKSHATTHTFKLTLTPRDALTGNRLDVSAETRGPASDE